MIAPPAPGGAPAVLDGAPRGRENRGMLELRQATSPADIEAVRALFREYARWVDEPCCFATFAQELEALPGEYAPPAGRLFLAEEAGASAGCVALRRLDAQAGEMKRLYVRPPFRGRGLGRRLATEVIAAARQAGYARLLLDTLPKMASAIALYRALGFAPRGPYSAAPTPGAVFFELRL
jgi:ribosomal protein S18 acetylase RimI-like enzyme